MSNWQSNRATGRAAIQAELVASCWWRRSDHVCLRLFVCACVGVRGLCVGVVSHLCFVVVIPCVMCMCCVVLLIYVAMVHWLLKHRGFRDLFLNCQSIGNAQFQAGGSRGNTGEKEIKKNKRNVEYNRGKSVHVHDIWCEMVCWSDGDWRRMRWTAIRYYHHYHHSLCVASEKQNSLPVTTAVSN